MKLNKLVNKLFCTVIGFGSLIGLINTSPVNANWVNPAINTKITEASVCSTDNSIGYSVQLKNKYQNVNRVEYKLKHKALILVPFYNTFTGYNWKQVGVQYGQKSNYYFNTSIYNRRITNDEALVSVHIVFNDGSRVIDPGGVINLGQIEKDKCVTKNQ